MNQIQFQNFKVQLHPPCTVKNTFLNVPEENESSDDELYTPFERCNMSAPPVLQDPAYVQAESGAAACNYYMRLPGPCPSILQLSFPEGFKEEEQQLFRKQGENSKGLQQDKTHLTQKVLSSSSQEEPEPQPGVQPMKSAGSVGHPDHCKECTFYFFSAAGCRNGADCKFCHEFHPRKNGKKNRRIMRTLQTREQDGKELSEEKPESVEGAPSVQSIQSVQSVQSAEKVQVKTVEDIPKEGAEFPGISASVGDGMLRVSYEKAGSSDTSGPVALTLITGVRTHLRPSLNYASAEGQRCLEPTLAFVVQPSLPAGLSLDAKTGSISGVPEATSPKAGVHVVTVKVPAQGYGGIALGEVPLASCKLFLTVRPLQNFMLTGSDSTEVLLTASDQ
mmetsp:Transcript_16605/g.31388  ORF Transcript_16605/g.31388 Transcript_16605/m.31388 type:complete len:391 (-) Transcript_16605:343-1515(-)